MELHPTPRLSGEAASACQQYLERLPLPLEAKRLVLDQVGLEADPARAMAALHQLLAGGPATATDAASASVRRRLQLACPSPSGDGLAGCIEVDRSGRDRLVTTPPLHRTPMAPSAGWASLASRVRRGIWRGIRGRRPDRPGADPELRAALDTVGPWHRAAAVRRTVLTGLVLGQTAAAAYGMTSVLPYHGGQPLEVAILVLFTILFGWVSVGFWTGLVGFLVLVARKDRYAITRSLGRSSEIPPDARTAVVMPICNEDVRRAFAGLQATYESLARTGALERFDFFVLSDSADPDARVAELKAWVDLCCAVNGFGRIFHRWRRHRIKRKSGNVADFCRRWGSQYRYMVVLDADSVMSGECLTALVRLMEAHPATGIIQTAPRAAGRETLYARIQQFATRVYGPVFTAGLNFWQLGESYYWGHNAIIRVRPFMRHCALGRLPGWGVFSGEILSHDFVEAALMRRAGWSVWIAYDLPGSYEEVPPNVLDELNRDRRWCQGNLINFRLSVAEGLHPAHRAVFMAGAMSYLSSPLWLVSLAVSTAFLVVQTVIGPQYFVQPRQLFPHWPEWHLEWAIGLAAATGSVLFLPKVLGALVVLARGARQFGGATWLGLSLLLEMVFSALLAPIYMLFHTQFVLKALTGWRTRWTSPPREDAETSWGEALRRHGGHTLLGIVWAGCVYRLAPAFLWWLLPVVGALALSIPLSVYSSRSSLGRRFRRARLFLIPEETRPPPELATVRRVLDCAIPQARFADAVVHPLVNALACAAAAGPSGAPAAAARGARARLVTKAVREGPAALTRRERTLLLGDPGALARLHLEVWTSARGAASWLAGGLASRQDDHSRSKET